MSDPSLVGFGHSLARTLVQAGPAAAQDGTARRLVEDSWHAFRAAGGDRVPIGLRIVGSYDHPGFYVERWRDAPIDLLSTLPPAAREASAAQLAGVFARGHVQLVELLPNLVPDELSAAVATLHKIADHPGLSLVGRQIYNVVALGGTLAVRINRRVSRQVAECLDLLYVALTAIDRFGTRLRIQPNDLVQCQVGFAVGNLRDPLDLQSFMASIDLVAGHLPPRWQQGLLRLLASMVPANLVAAVIEGCDRAVSTAGSPEAIESAVDEHGIPLAGHWLVAAALRERLHSDSQVGAFPQQAQSAWGQAPPAAPAQGTQPPQEWAAPAGFSGGFERTQHSGVHRIPQMRQESGIYRMPGWQAQELGAIVVPTGPRPGSSPGTPPPQAPNLRTESSVSRAPRATPGSSAKAWPSGNPLALATAALGPRQLDERASNWVESYEKMGPKLLDRAGDPSDAARYTGAITILANVAGYWLEEGQWTRALPIVRLLKRQEGESTAWETPQREALAQAMAIILPHSGIKALARAIPETSGAERQAVLELLAMYSDLAVPELLSLILGSKLGGGDRREIAAAIEATGPASGPALLDAITKNGRHVQKVTPLIGMVGAVGYRAGEQKVADFLRHPQASVREEAVVSLYKMLEGRSARYLMIALGDQDVAVRQRAVALLAAGRSREASFISYIHEKLSKDGLAEPKNESAVVSTLHAIRDLGNVELAQGVDVEGALVDALKESAGGGLLGRLSGKAGLPVGVQRAMCSTLGVIGSTRAKGVLKQLEGEGARDIQEAAAEALQRIEARVSA